MSNGIGKNPLNDISKVYVQQVVEKKKDDTYLEPDMKKRQANNEKARKELAKGPQMKNPHFESVEKSGWDAIKACTDGYEAVYDKQEVEEVYAGKHGQTAKQYADSRSQGGKMVSGDSKMSGAEYTHGRRVKAANPGMQPDVGGKTKPKSQGKMDKGTRADLEYRKANLKKEGLDPVGQEDGDVNNDGKKDSSDKYLMKRRKAIAAAMASTKKKMTEGVRDLDPEKGTEERKARLEKKRGMKMDDHPQYKKSMKEAYSSWRNDLSEVMTDEISDKPIKEKKVSNTIKINPKLGEAIQAMGGELIEATEVDEAVYGGTPAKKEEPKDTRMVVTNADKKGNTPAYQRFKAGDKRYKAADHMKEQAAMSDKEIRLQKQKARIDQMIAQRRKQDLAQAKKSEAPAKAVGEELSVDDQMRISKEYNRKSPEEKKALNKKAVAGIPKVTPKKDTRTDAQKMTDATGPRPGSRYRGD
ncbi:gp186 [Synechococcus phage S-SM2]|uniref:Gp186 n=1 Tax=Synechococcus phage S-SM2 TaxID=444860 RepID=E3SJ55_9CAUD|nr:gp186 [Synechococcus phage S-SM2]ADO97503.1 gp186 [Synechococcus phage S-SM2]